MIGVAGVILALLFTLASVFYYGQAHFAYSSKQKNAVSLARRGDWWYGGSFAAVCITSLYFLYLIFADQFQFLYVYGYSSSELGWIYKLSVFWAGQEGSFLLWLLFHGCFGMYLLRRISWTPFSKSVYGLLQGLLLILLIIKSPFRLLGVPATEGNGLNLLLQDPWMIVHPPIVFLGYAALAVPFTYAMQALSSDRRENWIKPALTWTLFACGTLGAGIFIGGFWAYKVLGWGGYWAWDPVENSSLVPWLIAVSMVHVLLLARIRPAAEKLVVLHGVFCYVLVLYGSFLTRSGLLSDFSTHSFSNEGSGGIMAVCTVTVFATAMAFAIIRWPRLPKGLLYDQVQSREFILLCTFITLTFLAALVCIGMSTPVFTLLAGQPQNLDTHFYNTVTLPLTVIMLMLLTASVFWDWKKPTRNWKKKGAYAIIGLLGLGLGFIYHIFHPLLLLTFIFATAAFILLLVFGKREGMSLVSRIAHLGLIFLIVGIIVSSVGSRAQTLQLNKNQEQEVFGKNLVYQGEISEAVWLNELLFQWGNQQAMAVTKRNKDGNPGSREPAIFRSLQADLYLAPHADALEEGQELTVSKAQPIQLENWVVSLSGISMEEDRKHPGEARILAHLVFASPESSEEVTTVMLFKHGQLMESPVMWGQYRLFLSQISPAAGKVVLRIQNLQTEPLKVRADVTYKPLMNLLWLGCVLLVGALLAAAIQESRQHGKSIIP